MGETPHIEVDIQPGLEPWMFTNRPFALELSSEEISSWESETGLPWRKLQYALAFEQADIDHWSQEKDQGCAVLEVGTGGGAAFTWLQEHGVNMYGMEPTLKYIFSPNRTL